jgi:hypothetical protein
VTDKPRLIDAPEGPEKLCGKCGEYWPATVEFFKLSDKYIGGVYHSCRACEAETRMGRRKAHAVEEQAQA